MSKTQKSSLELEESQRLEELTRFERDAWEQGLAPVAGVDEAGRGPFAGPVVAAACIIPPGIFIEGVDDSKKLSPKAREELFFRIKANPEIVYGIGVIDAETIDCVNILEATRLAIHAAVANLPIVPKFLLIDGRHLSHPTIPSQCIVKGDSRSQSIAAASIIAKVTRDQMMDQYHLQWPVYGFDRHKGYGTALHRNAMAKYGLTSIHRKTFQFKNT